jgi:macrolide transport system ATP-binding/permease protein
MSWLGEQRRRFMFWIRRSELHRELSAEMATHRELREEHSRKTGLDETDAKILARLRFGNATLLAEESRAFWGWRWLDITLQDVRYAIRQVRRSPGFSVVAALTLAIGIGANTAVFTLFNAFVLKPLPVPAPNELVHVKRLDALRRRQNLLSYLDFRELQERNRTFSGLAAYNKVALRPETRLGATPLSVTDFVGGLLVTGDYFRILGAVPALGHLFTEADDQVFGRHPVAVLGWRYWQRAYGADPEIVGRTVRLQGQPFTVVGVTGPGFVGPEPVAPDVYLPLMMRDSVIGPGGWVHGTWRTRHSDQSILVLGRLKPGLTMAQGEADLQSIVASWQSAALDGTTGVALRSAATLVDLDTDFLNVLTPMTLALGLVLLLCCANVANLFLARATSRRREIAVRLSLGAHRSRIIRQLLTESTIVALLGGALGLLLAVVMVRGLAPVVLSQMPAIWRNSFQLDVAVDARVFAWTSGVSLLSGLLFGLVPAIESTRRDVAGALKNEGSTLGRRFSGQRLRGGLLVAQVAISILLLVCAGLLLRSLEQLGHVDVGFRTRGAAAFALSLDGSQDPKREAALRWQLAERLRLMPGIEASVAWRQVLSGWPQTLQARLSDGRTSEVYANLVSTDHFSALGLRLVRGRTFTREEADGDSPVSVITSSTARQLWPGQEPLGQQIRLRASGSDDLPERTATVVGVVADTRSGLVWLPDTLFFYLPLPRSDERSGYVFVHAANTEQAIAAATREAAKLDARIALTPMPLENALRTQLLPFAACAALASILGLCALAVAVVGLYGVVSYLARQRTKELGIRVALGATQAQVTALVVRQGLYLVGWGGLLGLIGGVAASRLFRAVLAGLSPVDPATFAGVVLLLGMVALAALYLPARRTSSVDPMAALRQD